MPRLPGTPKTGGRGPGVKNKRTSVLREHLEQLDLIVPDRLVQILPKLPLSRQADILISLLPYMYPKPKVVDPKDIQGDDRKLTFTEFIVKFEELAEKEAQETPSPNTV